MNVISFIINPQVPEALFISFSTFFLSLVQIEYFLFIYPQCH